MFSLFFIRNEASLYFVSIFFDSPDLSSLINQLARQFDVDPLLQYSVIWIHLQRDQIEKLPALYEKNRGLLGSSLNAEGLAQGFHCIVQNISENNIVPDESTQKVSQLSSTFIYSVCF